MTGTNDTNCVNKAATFKNSGSITDSYIVCVSDYIPYLHDSCASAEDYSVKKLVSTSLSEDVYCHSNRTQCCN